MDICDKCQKKINNKWEKRENFFEPKNLVLCNECYTKESDNFNMS